MKRTKEHEYRLQQVRSTRYNEITRYYKAKMCDAWDYEIQQDNNEITSTRKIQGDNEIHHAKAGDV